MTRALYNLIHGNILKAIWYNMMLIPIMLVGLYFVYRYIRFLVKNEPILNKSAENILKILFIVLLIFTVIRNMTTLFF